MSKNKRIQRKTKDANILRDLATLGINPGSKIRICLWKKFTEDNITEVGYQKCGCTWIKLENTYYKTEIYNCNSHRGFTRLAWPNYVEILDE